MRGQRLFVTGGTGFFGCWLVESFVHINRALSLNAHLTILTRAPGSFARRCPHLAQDPAVSFLRGDVRSFAFPRGEYPFVLHAATDASARQLAEQPLTMLSTILDGTARALEFAASHGTRKLLLASSGAVYGTQPADVSRIGEEFGGSPNPLDPASVYGEGKRMAETMCAVYAGSTDLEIKIARCFAFAGPHLPLDAHYAFGNFLADALAGRTIRIAGDGTAVRSYLYAADLAIGLWTMLFQAPSMRAYNVGSERAVSVRELAETVAAVVNPGSAIAVAREPDGAPGHRYVPSTARARTELGLRETVPLEEAIRRTAAWHRIESR